MNITIVRPRSSQTIDCLWLDIETYKGNLVIQQGHALSYIIIKPNTIISWELMTGARESIKVQTAFLKVERDSCVLMIENE